MTITITVSGEAERLLAALCEMAGTSAEEIARDGVAGGHQRIQLPARRFAGTDDADCATRSRADRTRAGTGRSRPDPRARTTGDRRHARHVQPCCADSANADDVARGNLTDGQRRGPVCERATVRGHERGNCRTRPRTQRPELTDPNPWEETRQTDDEPLQDMQDMDADEGTTAPAAGAATTSTTNGPERGQRKQNADAVEPTVLCPPNQSATRTTDQRTTSPMAERRRHQLRPAPTERR